MLEYMVEYGKRGITYLDQKVAGFLNDDISQLELYQLSKLSEVELKYLMFYLKISESSKSKQPVESMDEDEMKLEYVVFRKKQINFKDDLLDLIQENRRAKYHKFVGITKKVMDVITYS